MAKLTTEEQQAIWTALDQLSRRHRAHPTANWVIPESDLSQLDQLAAKFRPVDPVAKNLYLFAQQMPDLGSDRSDFAAYDAELAQKRREAISEIFHAEGMDGVHRLLDAAKEAFAVGWSVADSGIAMPAEQVLHYLDGSEAQRVNYALGYARQRSHKEGLVWVDVTLDALRGHPLAQARVLRVTPIFPDVWERATKAGPEVEAAYWQEFVGIGLGTNFEWLNDAATKLLEHGNTATAVDLLAMYADRNDPPPNPDLVADALDAFVKTDRREHGRVSPYELKRLLDLLLQAGFEENRLAVLEWQLLPGLGYGAPAPALERQLAREPTFFVQILALCFKRSDGTTEPPPAPQVAQNAFHLLHEWRVVPGSSERGGEVEEVKLREWLDGALAALREADRLEIGLTYIGHVFAHARADEDGAWPTKPIRDAIERLASEHVDQGFGTQIYNNRGVTSRSLTAGGQQERALAEKFEKWEEIIRDRWPRTAAVLRSVAQGYRAQGQAEDEEAERFKKGLDPF